MKIATTVAIAKINFMNDDIYACAGRNTAPLSDYDFTGEYLARLRGADFIPVRKKKAYQKKENENKKRNYLTPLMHTIKKSRSKGKEKRSETISLANRIRNGN